MKTLIMKCSHCCGVEKLHVEDNESILADGAVVRVLCELCLDTYQHDMEAHQKRKVYEEDWP